MNKYERNPLFKSLFFVILDLVNIALASVIGLLLRFDLDVSKVDPKFLDSIWNYIPFFALGTIIVFFLFRLYHTLWIYAGINELINITLACICAVMVQIAGMQLTRMPIPRSYYILSGIVLYILTIISRFTTRLVFQVNKNLKYRSESYLNAENTRNVMVIGGGEAANIIIKEIKNSSHIHDMVVKCVIDDSYDKVGKYIQRVKVVGNRDTILYNVKKYRIDEIIIAIPSVSKKTLREIINICNETDCEVKILPGVYQLVSDEVAVSKLRKVEIEDLLGRDIINVDKDSIMSYIENKVIVVTGGGGTVGSELCRQIATYNPKQLIILDIYENGAYEVQQELIKKYPNLDLQVLIATVCNFERINHIFATYKPNIVFHAAAYKNLHLMEESPNEVIKNNVVGTLNTVKAADINQVGRFVLISSDKAVNPINIMGASKRICEMIIQIYNKKSSTEFVAVRFGDVLGSSGSVVELFEKQIKAGGPVTVTHPEIIRYFMTISEVVSLILQVGAYAKDGEIFVIDMGEPVKIADLANNLIRLSGYRPNIDIVIEYTGLRPGEKLYDKSLTGEEGIRKTSNKLIYITEPINIDYDKYLKKIEELVKIAYTEPDNIRQMVKEIVPTYKFIK